MSEQAEQLEGMTNLLASGRRRLDAVLGVTPPRWLLIDVEGQRLLLVEDASLPEPVNVAAAASHHVPGLSAVYRVSTAAAGVDGREESGGTPPGVHVIAQLIGDGQPAGAVFRSREATGEIWRSHAPQAIAGTAVPLDVAACPGYEPARPGDHSARGDDQPDLILTRVLVLDGCEAGINRGPGVDSHARYIYIHGTNHEAALGSPASHGCVRMGSADLLDLFPRISEGDPVVVLPAPAETARPVWCHFAGIGGSGMSALAQYHAGHGGRVSGSDRAFDRGERGHLRRQLEALGVVVAPQDGSGLVAADSSAGGVAPEGGRAGTRPVDVCHALIVSTAVEESVPDVQVARRLGVPILHRAELLSRFVRERRTIAVAGTSGKSTVVAMIFEILRGAGRDPSLITGGELVSLQRRGLAGNAWAGGGDLLVIEADESDGSLVRYEPWLGMLLNLQRDHKEPAEIAAQFEVFRSRTRGPFLTGEDASLAPFAVGARRFGLDKGCDVRAEEIQLVEDGSRFTVAGERFAVPTPGLHNVRNAVAAIAACEAAGVALSDMVQPLWRFEGVARRFQVIGRARGIEVIDDFAHNPDKIRAALATARVRGERVLAVYQPHGYGPTRFLRDDLIATFAEALRPEDRLFMPEIYYAGGTVTRDVSSREIVEAVAARGTPSLFAERREDLFDPIVREARPGDVIIVMGARDPGLSDYCRQILAQLRQS